MIWHYERLINYQQSTHVEIMYASEKIFRISTISKPAISFIIFVGPLDVLSV